MFYSATSEEIAARNHAGNESSRYVKNVLNGLQSGDPIVPKIKAWDRSQTIGTRLNPYIKKYFEIFNRLIMHQDGIIYDRKTQQPASKEIRCEYHFLGDKIRNLASQQTSFPLLDHLIS